MPALPGSNRSRARSKLAECVSDHVTAKPGSEGSNVDSSQMSYKLVIVSFIRIYTFFKRTDSKQIGLQFSRERSVNHQVESKNGKAERKANSFPREELIYSSRLFCFSFSDIAYSILLFARRKNEEVGSQTRRSDIE